MAHWILVRGLTRDSRHWGDFPAMLAAALPGQPVHALDLAGNGMRCREESPTTVGGMVDDLREAIRERGIAGPHRVFALSLGGMVALEWAFRHPGEVDAAVLASTSVRALCPFHRRLRPGQYGRLLRLAACGSAREQEAIVMAMTSNRFDPARLDDWARWRESHPVSTRNALRQVTAAARYRGPAVAISPPVLLLASRGDRLVDVRCSRAMAATFGWPLHEHDAAGHDIALDDPCWVVERIVEWARERGRASGTLETSPA